MQSSPTLSNRPDTKMLAIGIASDLAGAELGTLESWSFELGDLVAAGAVEKQAAADMLHFAALGAGLYRRWGTIEVHAALAAGFEECGR